MTRCICGGTDLHHPSCPASSAQPAPQYPLNADGECPYCLQEPEQCHCTWCTICGRHTSECRCDPAAST